MTGKPYFSQFWEQKKQTIRDEANRLRREAENLRQEAGELRRRSKIDSEKSVTETQNLNAKIHLLWRAVDTSTGQIVSSGEVEGADSAARQGSSQESAFRSSETTSSSRYEDLVNSVISRGVAALTVAAQDKLSKEPFRAKVAKVDSSGVVINAGADLGVSVGDTFGVRGRADAALTDPDTGLALNDPGPPVGVIRVISVSAKSSLAQVLRKPGPIERGSELEWIGMFNTRE